MDEFSLELSQAELYWLASAFGYAQYPLAMPAGPDPLAMRRQGQESLQARGLVHRNPGAGWQVERGPAGFVRWVAEAQGRLSAERFDREAPARRADVFSLSGRALLVTLDKGRYRFAVTADPAALPALLLAQLGASFPDEGPGLPAPTLIQPLELIRAAWERNPHLDQALARQGQSDARRWLESLEWAVTVACLQVGGDPAGAPIRALLCGNSQGAWGGSVPSEAGKTALSPVDAAGGQSILQALIDTLPE